MHALLASATLVVGVLATAPPASAAFGYLSTFGSGGMGDGQFFGAFGIAADSAGNVYVADPGNYRVQKLDADGNFLRTWGWGVQDGANAFQICTSGCRAGLAGSGDGAFERPVDVAVDTAGNVYVVEGDWPAFDAPSNNRVQKFDSNGSFLAKWGGPSGDAGGGAEGQLRNPRAVDTHTDPGSGAIRVYVAENGNRRVSQFDSNGTFVRMWGWGVDDGSSYFQICTSGCQAGLNGYGAFQFFELFSLATDSAGFVYTLENGPDDVQKFDATGNPIAQFDAGSPGPNATNSGIDVDSLGFVYVTASSLKRFAADGTLADSVADCGGAGVGVHPSGKVYVGTGDRVRVFGEGGGSSCNPGGGPPPGDGGGGGPGGTTGLSFGGREGVTINAGALYTNDPRVTLTVVPPGAATELRITNDGGFNDPTDASVCTTAGPGTCIAPVAPDGRYAWSLPRDSDLSERIPKTVYVRFVGPGGASPLTFSDDVILDTTAPQVTAASLSGGGGAAAVTAAGVRRFTLRVRARDNASGVGRLQLARSKRRPGKLQRFRRKLRIHAARPPAYLRVQDRAGNFSKWRAIKPVRRAGPA